MSQPIFVVGIPPTGAQGISADIHTRILQSDILVGGPRLLALFPDFAGNKLIINRDVDALVAHLRKAHETKRVITVLASGDPLLYGIGSTLRRFFNAEELEFSPTASSFQLAFSVLGMPWQHAVLLSAHGRSLDGIVRQMLRNPLTALLTDGHNTPQVIAQKLLDSGLRDAVCHVCQDLGLPRQQVDSQHLRDMPHQLEYAPLNVFVLEHDLHVRFSVAGLSDEVFETSAGQLTKREVRMLSIAEMGVGPHQVVWDVGAGCGSVGIEAALHQPTSKVIAIEKRTQFCDYIHRNKSTFQVANLDVVNGEAPAALATLPDPHIVFIGGSGGQLESILSVVKDRLCAAGRIVLNLVILENVQLTQQLLPGARLNQVQVNRAVPIRDASRFEAVNPVYIVSWQKES